jgi:predicted dienelactone hydrolase
MSRITKFIPVVVFFTTLAACSASIPPPELDGSWSVGATVFELNNEKEWFQVRAWYPSNQKSAETLLSSDKLTNEAFSEVMGIPNFLITGDTPSRSSIDVVAAEGTYPVIIFNHGLMSYARQNTTQFEQLASHGYIVMSVANPGVSMLVVRQNGDVVKPTKDSVAYQALENQRENFKQLAPQLKKDVQNSKASNGFTEFSTNMETLAENPIFAPISDVFPSVLANNLLLIDSLQSIQGGDVETLLKGHLDLQHVGAYGHSFGSIVSGILAMESPVIKAIVGLDAPQLNLASIEYKQINIPACYIYADALEYGGELIDFNRINKPLLNKAGSCEALFKESNHYNFTDLNLIPPLRYSSMLGDVNNDLMASNLEILLLAFFDTHLKQKDVLQNLALEQVELNLY